MRIRRQLALIMAMALLAVAVGAMAAGAGVERYQFTEDTYLLLANNRNYHEYTVEVTNPCDGTYTATGMFMGTDFEDLSGRAPYQVLTDWVKTDTTISFHSDYINSTYYFDFVGTTTDGVEWVGMGTDPTGPSFSWPATLTLTNSWTSDYNHGEYVAANVEEYGNPETAHSCIGMPMVSNRDK